jgi:hypothetical protein
MTTKRDVGLHHEYDFPPSTRSILNFNERVEAGVQNVQEAATEHQIPCMHTPMFSHSPPVVTHQLMLNHFTPDNQKNADEQEYLAEWSKSSHHEQCQQGPQQGISALQSIADESTVEETTFLKTLNN